MSEQNKQQSGISQEARDKAAAQLDQVMVEAYEAENNSPQIRQSELAQGDYCAVVQSSWLFTSDHDGALWIGFRLHIKGKMNTFGQMTECDWYDQGILVKAFKLEGNEYNVKMLLGLYRALGVKRRDGEAVCLGGDLCRTAGIPRGTWISIWVKRGNDGTNYVAKMYPPRLTAEDEAAAFGQAVPEDGGAVTQVSQAEAQGDTTAESYDNPPASVYSDELPSEPPF